jgi:hypothetical protein
MATSSILGGERAPARPSGRDTDVLGPSDTSDSGRDVQGERGFDALDEGEIGGDRADLASDSDASGTGERGAAVHDTDIVEGADIAPDRIEAIDPDADDGSLEAVAADTLTDDADSGGSRAGDGDAEREGEDEDEDDV